MASSAKRILFKKWDGSAVVSDTRWDTAAQETAEGAPNYQIHRGDLHAVLLAKAQAVGVEIAMGARVAHLEDDAHAPTPRATLATVDGSVAQVHTADVILAADGYRSRARGEMPGGSSEPRSAGTSAFRCVVPRERFLGDPELEEVVKDENQMTLMWYAVPPTS